MATIVRVEYYHDLDPARPDAFERFMYRLTVFYKEYGLWATVVLDSVTFFELAARNREMWVLNPFQGAGSPYAKGSAFDTRQWHAGSTTACEGVLITRFSSLPMNRVVVCHIDERQNEVSGEILRGPFAPGRLSKRGQLTAASQETYHSYSFRNEQGQRDYALHTQNDGQWIAATQINAPHPCWPDYEHLWANWKQERLPLRVLIYGDSGTGKTTFASTFRKAGNVLVWCFDPKGKELPYMKGANKVGPEQNLEVPGSRGMVQVEYRDIFFD